MSSSNQTAPPPRKSRGRQKVKMVKMENHNNLQVTFSKRRAGLFKKASELCTLCGAEAAIVVFSPANKAYCFGHPAVKTVLDRLQASPAPEPENPRSHVIIEAHRNSNIRDLNIELTRVESLLRAERRRAEEIEVVRKAGRQQQWLPLPSLEGMDYAQLGALKEAVMGFKKEIDGKVNKEKFRVSNQLPNSLENPNGFGGEFPILTLGFGDMMSSYNNLNAGGGVADYSTTTNNMNEYLKGVYGNWSSDSVPMFNVVGGSTSSSTIVPNDSHMITGGDQAQASSSFFQMF